ncbi:hypothetical protein CENSYa_1140 [Cenarchaeum symbiosum A]|uniref:Uncharacterized protein n=1 Tax=Cenarchaeum symbiosum (strain A) TaxID=414004 RepID=A0RWQ0_CENSY|nr:hypothetical protein CENSYa_1140 [Cenarchaeum symbiosum A]
MIPSRVAPDKNCGPAAQGCPCMDVFCTADFFPGDDLPGFCLGGSTMPELRSAPRLPSFKLLSPGSGN